MQGTIQLKEFSSRSGPEEFPLETIQIEPKGLNLTFVRGRDERTRLPLRYKIALFPATLAGTWEQGEETGSIEAIIFSTTGTTQGTVVQDTHKRFRGIWVEAGLRHQVEITIQL